MNPDQDPFGHTLPVKQACLIVTTLEFYHMNLSNAREICRFELQITLK